MSAVRNAPPGTTVLVAPGTYAGDMYFRDIHGTAEAPIVIAAADADNPPVVQGGVEGMKFASPAWLRLKNFAFKGSTGNALNIDDGGSDDFTGHDIVLEGIHIINTAYGYVVEGIKLTGLKNVRVEQCRIDAYPTGRSEGIDIVGGENIVITGCTFKQTYRTLQMKGGVEQVRVIDNRFIQPFVGHDEDIRELQMGGSMGACCFDHFKTTPWAQARDVVVAGNTFIGSQTPVLFVGSVGGVVKYNTFYRPGKWIFRILRENRDSQFAKTQGGVFKKNIIVYRTDEMSPEHPVNIGADSTGVLPGTFTISSNWWYAKNDPQRSRPRFSDRLPPETDGVYGIDPQLADPAHGDLSLESGSPAAGYGAGAYRDASTSDTGGTDGDGTGTVPQSQMEIVAASSQQDTGPATDAIDGDRSTHWHSEYRPIRYRVSEDPQWITISLGQTYNVSTLRYLPRQDSGPGSHNGIITRYEIYTSMDGTNFTQVASGRWTDDKTEKSASFAATKAAYIRLVATAAVNDNASAAEINIDYAASGSQLEVAAVSSEQISPDQRASKAIDGDRSTHWHSEYRPIRYRVSQDPQWITLSLGGVHDIDTLKYLPRQDSGPGSHNGIITRYQVYTSIDGTNFTLVASGRWADDKTEKSASFAATGAAYVRLMAIEAVNDNASAAEIRVE
ncbi:MAG TPA: discoidin domain-containing protein [Gammaproteobacteria bacterium]|nr:discoidin domain-containing protein [Gammaproteobacteria bacterium]